MSARARWGATVAAIALVGTIAREGHAQAADAAANRDWAVRATVGRVEHRVDAGFGVGTSKGTVLGVAARLRRWSAVEIDAHAWGGRLDADEIAGDDRKVGELGVQASVPAMPWLALVASATIRGVDAAPAVQRWTQLGAGAELRYGFADGLLQSVVHASLLPRVSVSGGADPDIGVGSGASLRLEHGRLHAVLAYSVERYGFPNESGAASRREQLSGLQLGIGARW
jgi:hypothetical protein